MMSTNNDTHIYLFAKFLNILILIILNYNHFPSCFLSLNLAQTFTLSQIQIYLFLLMNNQVAALESIILKTGSLRTLTPNNITQSIISGLALLPSFDDAIYLVDNLKRINPQVFLTCFSDKNSLVTLISTVPALYVSIIMKHVNVDRYYIKHTLEKRVSPALEGLDAQLIEMQNTVNVLKRSTLSKNSYLKARYYFYYILEPFKAKPTTRSYLHWLALMSLQIKDFEFSNAIIKTLVNHKPPIQLNQVFELLSMRPVGRGNLVQLLISLNLTARQIATGINFYSMKNNVAINQLLLQLVCQSRLPKMLQVVSIVANNLVAQKDAIAVGNMFDQIVKECLLASLPTETYFMETEEVIRLFLQLPQKICFTEDEWKYYNEDEKNPRYSQNHTKLLQDLKPYVKSSTKSKVSGVGGGFWSKIGSKIRGTDSSHLSKKLSEKKESFKETLVFQTKNYVGLPNIGNSCYINSFIQGLFYSRTFTELFMKEKYSDCLTLQILGKIFQELSAKRHEDLTLLMTQFKSSLPPEFSSNNQQQDSIQLGREIINMICKHSTSQRLKNLFNTVVTQEIQCPKKHVISKKDELEKELILSFENPRLISKIKTSVESINLDIMLKQQLNFKLFLFWIDSDYFAEQMVEGDFPCNECRMKYSAATKIAKVNKMPELLVIVLGRFTFDTKSMKKKKVCDPVAVEDYLFLNNLPNIDLDCRYKIISFINHMGSSADSGHYQTYSRNQADAGGWLNFDDDYVTEIHQKQVREMFRNFNQFDTPYIFFYDRIVS